MNEITITLPIETVNAALAALSKMPYEFAKAHIEVLQQRGSEALAAKPEPTSAND